MVPWLYLIIYYDMININVNTHSWQMLHNLSVGQEMACELSLIPRESLWDMFSQNHIVFLSIGMRHDCLFSPPEKHR